MERKIEGLEGTERTRRGASLPAPRPEDGRVTLRRDRRSRPHDNRHSTTDILVLGEGRSSETPLTLRFWRTLVRQSESSALNCCQCFQYCHCPIPMAKWGATFKSWESLASITVLQNGRDARSPIPTPKPNPGGHYRTTQLPHYRTHQAGYWLLDTDYCLLNHSVGETSPCSVEGLSSSRKRRHYHS